MTSEMDTTMAKMNKGFLEWAEKTNRESYIQADEYVKDLRAIYDDAIERLDGKILGHLNKIETEEGLSLAEAKKWMSIEDSKKATDSLKDFIRQSEMFKIDPSLEQELRMMSRRVRISYLQGMELELKKSVASLMDTEQKKLFAHLSKSYENKYYKDLYGLSRIAGERPITKVDPRALDRLIRRPWCLDGKTIGDRLSQRQAQNISNLKTILGRSLATGLNQRETIKEISKTLGRSLRSASVLVHTETASIIEQASMDAYKEYGIDQYQITATLDLRTSEICQGMDGKVFNTKDKVQGINFPPFHPNCRTTTVPYFDDDIQREMDKEVGRMTRNPVSGKSIRIHDDMTYEKWYNKYVESNPKAMAKEKAWKNRFSDKKQHARYREVLGDRVPRSFKKFQNLKYTDNKSWDKIQDNYYVKSNINNGVFGTKINDNMQKPHNYSTRASDKSYLLENIDAQKLFNKYAGTGIVRKDRHGRTHVEICVADKNIGYARWAGKKTNMFAIHHSKKRTHIIPYIEKGE